MDRRGNQLFIVNDITEWSLRGPCGIVLYTNKSPNPVEQMIGEGREFHLFYRGRGNLVRLLHFALDTLRYKASFTMTFHDGYLFLAFTIVNPRRVFQTQIIHKQMTGSRRWEN